jgi:N-acetylmuramoyl-L-alanine amidase
MVQLIVRHLLVLSLAGAIALLLRRRSAALRHALWTIALIVCMALPLLQQVPIGVPAQLDLPTAFVVQPVQPLVEMVAQQSSAAAVRASGDSLPNLASLALGLYLIVATALVARWGLGWWMAVRLARKSQPLRWFHGARVVVVPDAGPLTFGWPRATIVVPDASFGDREQVLQHELAHVQRADFIWQATGALACALWWFSPAVWLAIRVQREEAERACDDRVLTGGACAPDYADSLLQIASMKSSGRRPATALVPLIRRAGLATRISSILAAGKDRRRAGTLAIIATAALLLPTGLFLSHEAIAAAAVADNASRARCPDPRNPRQVSLFMCRPWLPRDIDLKGKRIVLDPGHGGKDPGATRDGVREADRTLDIARRTADDLRRKGAIVTLTRGGDQFVSLEQRVALSAGQDLFLSIHLEAPRLQADAPRGQIPLSVYFHSEAGTAEETTAQDIASSIDAVRGPWGIGRLPEPEIIRRVNLKGLRDSNCLAYMINMGYLDNASDRARSRDAATLAAAAQALIASASARSAD